MIYKLGRFLYSIAITLVIACMVSFLLYNMPYYIPCEDGVTEFKREENTFYAAMTKEGIIYGRTNNEGYNNLFDYNEDSEIEILIMGNSHMEAMQVMQEESTASKLNELYKKNIVYSIGFVGHELLTSAKNLSAALQKYRPTKYIVVEFSKMKFSEKDLMNTINESDNKIVKNNENKNDAGFEMLDFFKPFMKVIRSQYRSYSIMNDKNNDVGKEGSGQKLNNEELLNELLKKMSKEAEDYEVNMIFVCHPGTELNRDGSLSLIEDTALIEQFKNLCIQNNIYFLDMSERIITEYYNNHTLPYGFINTSVGSGHLNKYGHAMMADELYKLIEKIESEGDGRS